MDDLVDKLRRYFLAIYRVIAALSLAIIIATTALSAVVRTVALTGQLASGTSGEGQFAGFVDLPSLNNVGQTAFHASLRETGIESITSAGIFSEGAENLELIASRGNSAAGTSNGETYNAFGQVDLNDDGHASFRAILSGNGVNLGNQYGMWTQTSAGLKMIARQGMHAPGTAENVTYSSFHQSQIWLPAVSNSGETAFVATLTDNSPRRSISGARGIWASDSDSLSLIALEGSAAPGTPDGVFNRIWDEPSLNDTGTIAFAASYSSEELNSAYNWGIWSNRSGELDLVAQRGTPAGTMTVGTGYREFSSFALNNCGHIAFVALIEGPDVQSSNDAGIWKDADGILSLVLREGDPAPGTPSGIVFGGNLSSPVLNDSGWIAFRSSLTGVGVDSTNDMGIWSEGTGALTLVAREGGHAPGTPSDVSFSEFITSPTLNSAGQTAFYASLSGNWIDHTNDLGVWATDRNGVLHLIARRGDILEVLPGDFRTIKGVGFLAETGNSDGRRSGFNNRGQLAFMAFFTDGSSGIFVSNLVAVPEPSSLTLGCILVLSLARTMLTSPKRRVLQ